MVQAVTSRRNKQQGNRIKGCQQLKLKDIQGKEIKQLQKNLGPMDWRKFGSQRWVKVVEKTQLGETEWQLPNAVVALIGVKGPVLARTVIYRIHPDHQTWRQVTLIKS